MGRAAARVPAGRVEAVTHSLSKASFTRGVRMKIVLNGSTRDVDAEISTVTALLEHLAMASQPLIVERNGDAVLRRDFPRTPVGDGDRFEIVRIVAGG